MGDRMTDDVSASGDGTGVSRSNSREAEQTVKANTPKRKKKRIRKTFPKGWKKKQAHRMKRALATVELPTDEAAAASDEPPVKTKPQTAPNQSQETSTSQTTYPTTSTSHDIEEPKSTDPNYRNEPAASTSAAFSSGRPDNSFWIKAVQSTFKNSEYRELLENAQFTEKQSNVLQDLLHQVSRKMLNVIRNRDRIMKTHKCMICGYSVSHQCVSIKLLHGGPWSAYMTQATIIEPEKTSICICQFALYHVHTTRELQQTEVEDTLAARFAIHLRQVKHNVTLSCLHCDSNVIIEHRIPKKLCFKLTAWNGLHTIYQKKFYKEIEIHNRNTMENAPSYEEFYNCENQCCLIFHRCVEPPADLGMLI